MRRQPYIGRQQLAALRLKVRKEIRATDAAFDQHIKKNGCNIDGCTDRAHYQERLATLRAVIVLLGGRVNESTDTCISDYVSGLV
jgi:hypothetical protein